MICDILGYVNNGAMGIYAGLVDRKISLIAFLSYNISTGRAAILQQEIIAENCSKNGLVYFAIAEVFSSFPHLWCRVFYWFSVVESSANIALEFDMLMD